MQNTITFTIALIFAAVGVMGVYHLGKFAGWKEHEWQMHESYCYNTYMNIAASEVGDECKDVFDLIK